MNCYGATAPEMSERERRNAALARRAAAESFVLLQNPDDTLPLKAKKIALYGIGGAPHRRGRHAVQARCRCNHQAFLLQ